MTAPGRRLASGGFVMAPVPGREAVMKLSDMLATWADNARLFESKSADWQGEMTTRNEQMLAEIRAWQADTAARQEEMSRQVMGHLETAGDAMKTRWQQMQTAWEAQLAQMQAQGDQMRQAALKMPGGAEGKGFADWAEAYATQMTSFAQKMQAEAAGAIATATEARTKAGRKA